MARRLSAAPTARLVATAAPALVALVTFVAFLPMLENGFVTWDDPEMLLWNTRYRGLGWSELRWMWTTFHLGRYRPVTWMTYGADYVVWGMRPVGYHLTALVLHTLAALLVYSLTRRLLDASRPVSHAPDRAGPIWGAFAAAVFFAIHPLRVEPVAWASARDHLVAGVFLLLSALAYLAASREPTPRSTRGVCLGAAVGLYTLSLLSQPANVTFPVVLAILDVYPLRRLGGSQPRWAAVRGLLLEKLAFVVPALVLGATQLRRLAATRGGAGLLPTPHELAQGVAEGVFNVVFYVRKTFVFGPLLPMYERPLHVDPLAWRFVLSGALVLTTTVLLVVGRRRWPGPLTAWLCYLTMLAPVSGVIALGPWMAADRYTYLSSVSWAMLVGAGVMQAWQRRREGRLGALSWAVGSGLAMVAVAGLGLLTWNQVQVWRDAMTPWRQTLAFAPHSAVAHGSLGYALQLEGKLPEAIEHYREALLTAPDEFRWRLNLGLALAERGELAEATAQLRTAVVLSPASVEPRLALGHVLLTQHRLEESAEQSRIALRLAPRSGLAHYSLGLALARQGQLPEAIEEYRAALALEPGLAAARTQLDLAVKALGDPRPSAAPSRPGASDRRHGASG